MTTREHGGNLDEAIARYGGEPTGWIDLSTGINPVPYPIGNVSEKSWSALPDQRSKSALIAAATMAYGTDATIVPFAGAQGAIQVVPWLLPKGRAAVVEPTYNEHAAALRAVGWHVTGEKDLAGCAGADLAVVVSPNNPDGRTWTAAELLSLSEQVGLLVIDESFADSEDNPSFTSYINKDAQNIVIMRSFGKFYGLAGLRLGFAISTGALADRLAENAGPWPVSGPAIEIATRAFRDVEWQDVARRRLQEDAARLDALARGAGWRMVGGTGLFRTYETPDARQAQGHLARHHIWSRIFSYSETWIRLGLPRPTAWTQLENAFSHNLQDSIGQS